jgi:HAD domain in Swiss Army Knife RNA repair proteins
MAVIFLDIDGVLNRSDEKPSKKARVIAAELLARFKELVDASGATVVLASTWRHDPSALETARRLGIPFNDVLPDLRPKSRATEVEAWLRTHGHSGRIAILDDDDDGYGDFPLFQPSPTEGLTPEVADAVLSFLNGTRDKDLRRSVFVRFLQRARTFVTGHRG